MRKPKISRPRKKYSVNTVDTSATPDVNQLFTQADDLRAGNVFAQAESILPEDNEPTVQPIVEPRTSTGSVLKFANRSSKKLGSSFTDVDYDTATPEEVALQRSIPTQFNPDTQQWESRPVTQEDIDAQIAREKAALDPTLAREFSKDNPNRGEKIFDLGLDHTATTVLDTQAHEMLEYLKNVDKGIEDKHKKISSVATLAQTALNVNTDNARDAAYALTLAVPDTVREINTMNLSRQDKDYKVQTDVDWAELTEQEGDIVVVQDDNQDQRKPATLKDAYDAGLRDGKSVEMIDNTARGIARRAEVYLNGEPAVAAREAALNPTQRQQLEQARHLLGLDLLTREADLGNIDFYTYTNPISNQTQYYVDFTEQGEQISNDRNKMFYDMNPQVANKDDKIHALSSKVPVGSKGFLGNYKLITNTDGVKVKVKGDNINPIVALEEVQGSVGRKTHFPNLVLSKLFLAAAKKNKNTAWGRLFKISDADKADTLDHYMKLGALQGLEGNTLTNYAIDETNKAIEQIIASEEVSHRLLEDNGNETVFTPVRASDKNGRIHEIGRDGDNSQKEGIRMNQGFAETPHVKVKDLTSKESLAEDSKNAKALFEMAFGDGDSPVAVSPTDAINVLNDMVRLRPQDLWEMNSKILWAREFLRIKGNDAPGFVKNNDFEEPGRYVTTPSLIKMQPWDLLDYYSQNAKSVNDTLESIGRTLREWVESGEVPEDITDYEMRKFLKRGDWGYTAAHANDIVNYMDALNGGNQGPGTSLELTAFSMVDQTNSNVALQGLASGNLSALATTGFVVNRNDLREWESEPGSYYTLLHDELGNALNGVFSSNKDLANALMKAYDKTKEHYDASAVNNTFIKDNNRTKLVSGFYGLHPRVDSNAAAAFIRNATAAGAIQDLVDAGYYESPNDPSLLRDIQTINGRVYDNVLGKISLSKNVNPLMGFIAINGHTDPNTTSLIGQILQMGEFSLYPEYLAQDIRDNEVTGVSNVESVATITTANGTVIPVMKRKVVYDTGEKRGTIGPDGQVIDTSKGPGKKTQDKAGAVMTHSDDITAVILNILFANKDREYGMPILTVHDADKVNAVSYLHNFFGNQFATESVSVTPSIYSKVPKTAEKTYDSLIAKGNKAIKNGTKINVGVASSNMHRALFTIFDKLNNDITTFAPTDRELDNMDPNIRLITIRNIKKKTEILNQLKKLGYSVPNPDDPTSRDNVLVTGQEFNNMVRIAAEIQGLFKFKKQGNELRKYKGFRYAALDKAEHNRIISAKLLKKGRYYGNGRN